MSRGRLSSAERSQEGDDDDDGESENDDRVSAWSESHHGLSHRRKKTPNDHLPYEFLGCGGSDADEEQAK